LFTSLIGASFETPIKTRQNFFFETQHPQGEVIASFFLKLYTHGVRSLPLFLFLKSDPRVIFKK
jgi:hypothetical protein